jgi:hypothetical protein
MPLLPEKPKAGIGLLAWLTSLWEFVASLVWSVDEDSGLEAEWTRGGWKLRVLPVGVFLAKTDGGITGRSGSTPGTGNVLFALFDGTDISYESDPTPIFNPYASSVAPGKDCWVVKWFRSYWLVVWTC